MKVTITIPKDYNISDIQKSLIDDKIIKISDEPSLSLAHIFNTYPDAENISIFIFNKIVGEDDSENIYILDPDKKKYLMHPEYIKDMGYIIQLDVDRLYRKIYPDNKLWTDEELRVLTNLSQYMTPAEMTNILPSRSELAIKKKLHKLDITHEQKENLEEIMSEYINIKINDSKIIDFTDNDFLENNEIKLSDYIYTGILNDTTLPVDNCVNDFRTMLNFCDSRFFILRNYSKDYPFELVDYINKEFKDRKYDIKFSDNIFVKLFALGDFDNFKRIHYSNSANYLDNFIKTCINLRWEVCLDRKNILIQKKFGMLFKYGIIFNDYDKTIELLKNIWLNIIYLNDDLNVTDDDDMDVMFTAHTIWLNMFESHGDYMLRFYLDDPDSVLELFDDYIFNHDYISYNIMIFNMKSTEFLNFIFEHYDLLNKNKFLTKLLTQWIIFNNDFMIKGFVDELIASDLKSLKITNKLMKKIGEMHIYHLFEPIFENKHYKFNKSKKLVDISKMSTMLINGRFDCKYLSFLLDMIIDNPAYYSRRYAELFITITEILQPLYGKGSVLYEKLSDTLKCLEYADSVNDVCSK